MTTVTQRDLLARQEYYKDQMRAAEKYRLVRVALSGRENGDRFTSRLLVWVGHRLVAWGTRLQEQYAAVVSASMSHSANPATGQ